MIENNRRTFLQKLVTTGVSLSAIGTIEASEDYQAPRMWVQDHIVAKDIHRSILGNASSQYLILGGSGIRDERPKLEVDGDIREPNIEIDGYNLDFSARAAKSSIPLIAYEIELDKAIRSLQLKSDREIEVNDKLLTALREHPNIVIKRLDIEWMIDKGNWKLKCIVINEGQRPGWFRTTYGPQYNPRFYFVEEMIQPGSTQSFRTKIDRELFPGPNPVVNVETNASQGSDKNKLKLEKQ